VLAAEYRTVLPKEPVLVAEIEKTIHAIETRRAATPKATDTKRRLRVKSSARSRHGKLQRLRR
jgi:hypothetical protein